MKYRSHNRWNCVAFLNIQILPSGRAFFYIAFFEFLLLPIFRLTALLKVLRLSISAFIRPLYLPSQFPGTSLGTHRCTNMLRGRLPCVYLLGYYITIKAPCSQLELIIPILLYTKKADLLTGLL
jgi:hypothetical protein